MSQEGVTYAMWTLTETDTTEEEDGSHGRAEGNQQIVKGTIILPSYTGMESMMMLRRMI